MLMTRATVTPFAECSKWLSLREHDSKWLSLREHEKCL